MSKILFELQHAALLHRFNPGGCRIVAIDMSLESSKGILSSWMFFPDDSDRPDLRPFITVMDDASMEVSENRRKETGS